MDICYATNSKYVDLMLVSILSFEKYNAGCSIHILHSSLSLSELNKITRVSKSNIHFYSVNEENYKSIIQKKNFQNTHFSVETFFRLLIPNYINLDKILYLDVDTMVRSDISELFEINLSDKPLAAVNWYEVSKEKLISLGMSIKPLYFNAGVMLLNLSYFREHYAVNELLSRFTNNPNRYPLVDQDILNEAINGRHYTLHEKYNFTGTTTKRLKFKDSTREVHFTGRFKPMYKFIQHPYKNEFVYYWISDKIHRKLIFNMSLLLESVKIKFKLKRFLAQIEFLNKLKRKILKEDDRWLRREF